MSNSRELFGIEVVDLYKKVVIDVKKFCCEPNHYRFLNAIFALYHLREWIHPGGCETYKNKLDSELTKEEKFYKELYEFDDYKIIRKLCNYTKHAKVTQKEAFEADEPTEGWIAGIGRAGDRLNRLNYLVDGKDLRSVMENVLNMYEQYFEIV